MIFSLQGSEGILVRCIVMRQRFFNGVAPKRNWYLQTRWHGLFVADHSRVYIALCLLHIEIQRILNCLHLARRVKLNTHTSMFSMSIHFVTSRKEEDRQENGVVLVVGTIICERRLKRHPNSSNGSSWIKAGSKRPSRAYYLAVRRCLKHYQAMLSVP